MVPLCLVSSIVRVISRGGEPATKQEFFGLPMGKVLGPRRFLYLRHLRSLYLLELGHSVVLLLLANVIDGILAVYSSKLYYTLSQHDT